MTANELATDLVHLPDAPAIPGLAFRLFRGESDYAAMVTVLKSSKMADGIWDGETVADLANAYAHLGDCDPFQNVLCAQVEGEMIGYNRAHWYTEVEGNSIYAHFGFLAPEWRRKGIGRAMLHHSERRLREVAAGRPADGTRFLQSEAADSQPGAEALLLSEGYAAARHEYEMSREIVDDIPCPPLPEGLEARPVRPEHYRAIWDAKEEAFRDHWGYRPETEQDYQRWLADPKFDPNLWRVAWAGDQVAGMVGSVINAEENAAYHLKRGWVGPVCVRRPWRRRGLAHALLLQMCQALQARGMTVAALGVDTQNLTGALRVYESVGFRVFKRFSMYRKPLE
jgi:mycothiol synthase